MLTYRALDHFGATAATKVQSEQRKDVASPKIAGPAAPSTPDAPPKPTATAVPEAEKAGGKPGSVPTNSPIPRDSPTLNQRGELAVSNHQSRQETAPKPKGEPATKPTAAAVAPKDDTVDATPHPDPAAS